MAIPGRPWLWLLASLLACGASPPPAAEPAASAAQPGPQGDTCNDPLPLPVGQVVLGSTLGGTDDVHPGCGSGTAPERIYRFTVERRSQFRAVLQADFDAVIALRESCSYANSELVCNDDERRGHSQRSRIDASLPPGDYFLIVDGARDASGDFELFATLDPIESAQAACAAAQALPFGETARGSTLGEPDRFQATCGHGAKAGERVYRIEVDAPSRLRVLQQTEYDGVLYLRERCEQPTSELACNDDFRGPHRSLLTARVGAGTYYLFTDGLESPQGGTFSLRAERIDLEPTQATVGAVCRQARALPVQPGVAEVDTFAEASNHGGSCGGQGAPEAVLALEVQQPSRLWVRLRDPEFNAVLYLRRGCTEVGSELACERQEAVDRGRPPGQPPARSLNLSVAPGTYYLFVDGVGADDFGAAQVEVALESHADLTALCRAAPRLRSGQVVEGRLSPARGRFRARCGREAGGPEHVYQLHLAARSLVSLDLDSSFDGVLHVRRSCADVESEVACNDDGSHSRQASVRELLPAGDYLVFVDGLDADELGPYRLATEISAAP